MLFAPTTCWRKIFVKIHIGPPCQRTRSLIASSKLDLARRGQLGLSMNMQTSSGLLSRKQLADNPTHPNIAKYCPGENSEPQILPNIPAVQNSK